MPSRPYQMFMLDVLIALEAICRLTEKTDSAEDLREDTLRYHTVVRMFEIVGEAMKYLVNEPALDHAKDLSWRGAIAVRNIVVHEYFGIDFVEMFRITKKNVPTLLKNFEQLCVEFKKDPLVELAFETALRELIRERERTSAEYIQKFSKKLYGK